MGSLARLPAEAAVPSDPSGPAATPRPRDPLRLPDVPSGSLSTAGTRRVPGLEGGEGHRQPVAQLEPAAAAEVGEAPRSSSAMWSPFATFTAATAATTRWRRRVPGDRGDRVPDVVVVVDRVHRLRLGAPARPAPMPTGSSSG